MGNNSWRLFNNLLPVICFLMAWFPSYSQPADRISLESGFVIDKFFPSEHIQTANHDPFNCFFKIEYAGKTFSKQSWSLFIPMGISYSYYCIDYVQSFNGQIKTQARHLYHYFSIYVGPELQYSVDNMRFAAGAFIHNRYVSSRVFGLFKAGKRLWIGPSCEIFYYDILYSWDEFKSSKSDPKYQKGKFFGMNGSAIRFNPGIKLQFDLKN